ncbi:MULTISPECIES: NAD-glutamate dehydrogenase [unclassified Rhodococcus (in: high G+C Gram-positive bacteria)]|uniref:NAD-glutamate dehydrogenase n=1 Tax=unclassified Rhodococcus (in: high G+C Gram-positive bacteria) TaxID=192944 RepID=UPI0016395A07|nr:MULTISPECIES: NAD-glutamate dehydrogenase [unclassified Rhodococcus (in: high G+C Gram-positive bacteria)]MBC2642222.1 NAD-glutamate dehydrogenase [Rhodococcus sp. 3A]MBC2893036.1 NAD-glutamate dehydrogenase [Rhodococcus sp. 4CII]
MRVISTSSQSLEGDEQLFSDQDARRRVLDLYLRAAGRPSADDGDPEARERIAHTHLDTGRLRIPGTAVVRGIDADDPSGIGPAVQIVTDDMALLVESVLLTAAKVGAPIDEALHPVLVARRSESGQLTDLLPAADPGTAESWIHVGLRSDTTDTIVAALVAALDTVLADVRRVDMDLARMRALQIQVSEHLDTQAGQDPLSDELREAADFLRWCEAGNFTVLGYARYGNDGAPGETLGVLHDRDDDRPQAAESGPVLAIGQAALPVSVHRSSYPSVIGVRAGGVEHRFVGAFTPAGRHENVLDIPGAGRRVRALLDRAGFDVDSFSGQAVLQVVQALPLTELFAASPDSLHSALTEVAGITAREHIHLFLRTDAVGDSMSALVFIPRDRYNTRTRLAAQRVLLDELGGTAVEYTTNVSEYPLAVVHFTMRVPAGTAVTDARRLDVQRRISRACRTWEDRFRGQAGAVPRDLLAHYADHFPEGYKHDFDTPRAHADVAVFERLRDGAIDTRLEANEADWRFTLFVGGAPASLGDVLPILQSLGVAVLDERPYTVMNSRGTDCWMYEFGIRHAAPGPVDDGLPRRFTETFAAAWESRAEADSFNELVLRAGLDWREVEVLRAYGRYLRQGGFPYSQNHIATVLGDHPAISQELIRLFAARFDPDGTADCGDVVAALETAIGDVLGLDADRILRAYLTVVLATLRTNRYANRGRERGVLSFKFDPQQIPELPQPRPRFEIYVYSPWVEGVHMRFGAVARGGLRWSDRKEDFRTEVLGLVKAQAVKNSVIVPVGAKGGFVVARPPAPTGDPQRDRDAQRAEGVRCYRSFISGLLDVTDNVDLASGAVIPAPRVVRHDGDDTYLVVAADKGTATFSDIANDVAAQYGFWLGDAFASGGSVGYDHKALGITAKGAWESVKRHFREMGVDTQSQEFTAVGIGDMSGDVFGNGMLASQHIRLVAAFDHRHVFLDPNPDAATSFAERERLFALPRSSWADYAPELISTGGGVWERSRKSVPISEEARRALGLSPGTTELSPPDLVRAILRAPVDLLWNGGIGTYVKAGTETHLDVGDKGNDGVRVDGADVRARVVGEGGNLGFTQLGRIEFSRAGGRINTDALDNSAGVDCSDHEVNIKVLLDALVSGGRLAAEDRAAVLAGMSGEVSALVLADNVAQNDVLGTSRADAAASITVHGRLIGHLEGRYGLDRAIEVLPSRKEIAARERAGTGLTSPELATLMAHVKLALKSDLLSGDLPDSPAFADALAGYFPRRLRETFGDAIGEHPLRREIVATVLTNDVVDNGGITYAFRLGEEAGASSADAVRAFAVVSTVFDLPSLGNDIREAGLDAALADELTLFTRRLLDRASRWMLTRRPQPLAVGAEISRFRDRLAELTPHVAGWLCGEDAENLRSRTAALVARGVPADLAGRVQLLLDRFALLDIVEIADITSRDPREVAQVYYRLGEYLGLVHLLVGVSQLGRGTRWNALARLSLRDELYDTVRALCLDVIAGGEAVDTAEQKIGEWEDRNAARLARARHTLDAVTESGEHDLAALSVATRQLRSMVR